MRRATALLIAVSALSGCGKLRELAGLDDGGQEPAAPDRSAQASSERPEAAVIEVTNTRELIEALGPRRTIELAPGRYTFADGESLPEGTDRASYDDLSRHYTGGTIRDVDGLKLIGTDDGVQIVTLDRNRPALNLVSSEGVVVENLTIGHGEGHDCLGAIVGLSSMRDVTLSEVTLTGCGSTGFEVVDSDKVRLIDSNVHDTSGLPLVVDSTDVLVQRTTFERNGTEVNPSGGGFGIVRAHVTFDDVVIADNVSIVGSSAFESALFSIHDDGDKREAADDPPIVEPPTASKVVVRGGTVRGNVFKQVGGKPATLTFEDTHWSDNSMSAPTGTVAGTEPPLALARLQVETRDDGSQHPPHALVVKADVFAKDDLGDSTTVLVRAVCNSGTRLLVDAGAMYGKGLYDGVKAGQSLSLETSLFGSEGPHALAECELDLSVGGTYGGLEAPLGKRCWKDGRLDKRACDPPLVPAPSSGTKPLTLLDISLSVGDGYDPATVGADLIVDIGEAGLEDTQIHTKVMCDIDGRKEVALGMLTLRTSPRTTLLPGHSMLRHVPTSLPVPATDAESCQLTFDRFEHDYGSPKGYREERIERVCWRKGTVTPGACDPSKPPPPAPKAISADTLTLESLELTPRGFGLSGSPQWALEVAAKLTLDEPTVGSPLIELQVRCKDRGAIRAETLHLSGLDLTRLDPGELARHTGMAFGSSPLTRPPKSCKATAKLIDATSGTTSGVPLGKWCQRKTGTKSC